MLSVYELSEIVCSALCFHDFVSVADLEYLEGDI